MDSREDQIKRAYEDLRTARIEMHEVSEKDLAARTALKQKEAALLLSGAITGKNAETRDAQLKEGCKEEMGRSRPRGWKRQKHSSGWTWQAYVSKNSNGSSGTARTISCGS